MSRSLSRALYLLAILAWTIGGLLLVRGPGGSAFLPHGAINQAPAAVVLAIPALLAGGVLAGISWIGALICTARLGRWSWFICLLLFSGIALLPYIFIGPQYPARPLIPVTTPPCCRYGD